MLLRCRCTLASVPPVSFGDGDSMWVPSLEWNLVLEVARDVVRAVVIQVAIDPDSDAPTSTGNPQRQFVASTDKDTAWIREGHVDERWCRHRHVHPVVFDSELSARAAVDSLMPGPEVHRSSRAAYTRSRNSRCSPQKLVLVRASASP